MDLNTLIKNNDIATLQQALDSMTHQERVIATRTLLRQSIERLFHLTQGWRQIHVHDFVGEQIGTNNMPLARAFSKPIFALPDGTVAGRNVHALQRLTGPGYFIVESLANGEVSFNYNLLPTTVPTGWPTVRDNAQGLSYFVFRNLEDVMRGVSQYVTVGRAFRIGKPLSNYFVLVRRP